MLGCVMSVIFRLRCGEYSEELTKERDRSNWAQQSDHYLLSSTGGKLSRIGLLGSPMKGTRPQLDVLWERPPSSLSLSDHSNRDQSLVDRDNSIEDPRILTIHVGIVSS
jgi:hypothetical protein